MKSNFSDILVLEGIAIADPQLAQQYANAQKQLNDKDKQIIGLQNKITELERQKTEIQKAMVAIEQKSAQTPVSKQQATPTNVGGGQSTPSTGSTTNPSSTSIAAAPTKESLSILNVKEINEEEDFEDIDIDPEIDDIDDEELTAEEHEKIIEDKVFYVKVEDEGAAFIGKIYKLEDDEEWHARITVGESETFDQLYYDPEWDEVDIIAFLRDNYADAELLSEEEYNQEIAENGVNEMKIISLDNYKGGNII